MFTIKDLEVKVKFSTANAFAKKYCNGKSIIEAIPDKMGQFDGEYLVEMLNFFQTNEKKLSKDDITKMLDEILSEEDSKLDVPTIYMDFLKEFDYAGVFKKGMGFMIVKKYEEALKAMENKRLDF